MKSQIFLSYSSQDKSWVEQFVDTLKEKGVPVWFDMASIKLGESFQESYASALRESSVLVVILSNNSVSSKWIYFELGAAVADDKMIIPILIDKTVHDQIPTPLMKYQYLQETSPVHAGEKVAQAIADKQQGITRQ